MGLYHAIGKYRPGTLTGFQGIGRRVALRTTPKGWFGIQRKSEFCENRTIRHTLKQWQHVQLGLHRSRIQHAAMTLDGHIAQNQEIRISLQTARTTGASSCAHLRPTDARTMAARAIVQHNTGCKYGTSPCKT